MAAAALLLGGVAQSTGDESANAAFWAKARCPSTQLSFVSQRQMFEQIYRLDVRRPGRDRRVTRLKGVAMDPSWAPDGRRFAFRWFKPNGQGVGVYVANADGKGVRRLAKNAVTPAWSPDGNRIAYARGGDSGQNAILVADVEKALRGDPSATRVLTRNAPGPQEYPQWSPNGTRLLFSGYGSKRSYDIWVMYADGSHLRDLTPTRALEYGATWSPNGKEIVFGSNRAARTEEGSDLFIMDVDGHRVRRLTRDGHSYGPAWSPDGRWIAFGSRRAGNLDLYLMRPDASHQRRLTSNRRDDVFPRWIGACRSR